MVVEGATLPEDIWNRLLHVDLHHRRSGNGKLMAGLITKNKYNYKHMHSFSFPFSL